MEVELFTAKVVAAVPPKVTEDAPVKLVPVILTVRPPAMGPWLGVTDVMKGGGVP
jgi:hypothetical protein